MPSASSSLSLIHTPTLSLNLAQHALRASLAHAESIGVQVNISIHSASLHLLAFAAMDNAKLTSIDIAHNKSFTAAGHRALTGSYGKRVEPGGGLYGVQHSNGGKFSTIQGGVPVVVEGVTVGAIGVSGAMPGQDEVSAGVKSAIRGNLSGEASLPKAGSVNFGSSMRIAVGACCEEWMRLGRGPTGCGRGRPDWWMRAPLTYPGDRSERRRCRSRGTQRSKGETMSKSRPTTHHTSSESRSQMASSSRLADNSIMPVRA